MLLTLLLPYSFVYINDEARISVEVHSKYINSQKVMWCTRKVHAKLGKYKYITGFSIYNQGQHCPMGKLVSKSWNWVFA